MFETMQPRSSEDTAEFWNHGKTVVLAAQTDPAGTLDKCGLEICLNNSNLENSVTNLS